MDLKGYFRRNQTLVTFVLLVTFSVLSLMSGGSAGLRESGLSTIGLIQRSTSAVGAFFAGAFESVRNRRDLRSEIGRLQERTRELELQQENIRALQIEAEQLRATLGYAETLEIKHVSARVIGRDPENIFPTLMINRGRRNGLERNMPVIAVQDGRQSLVGRLVEVGQYSSKVLPIYDVDAYVAAVHQESRYQGLISGVGSTHEPVTLHHIPRDAYSEIEKGDAIVTSGMRSIYPPDIAIGTVTSVEASDIELNLDIRVDPVVEFERLEFVYVVLQEGR